MQKKNPKTGILIIKPSHSDKEIDQNQVYIIIPKYRKNLASLNCLKYSISWHL